VIFDDVGLVAEQRQRRHIPLQQFPLLLERIDRRLEAAQVVDVAWEVGAAGVGIGGYG
jgi:hypothetical protein